MTCKHNCAIICIFKYVIYCLVGSIARYQYLISTGYFIIYDENWVDKQNKSGIIALTLCLTGEKYE